jgi:hypothetical protein
MRPLRYTNLNLHKQLIGLATLAVFIISCGSPDSAGNKEVDSLAIQTIPPEDVATHGFIEQGETALMSLGQSGNEFNETALNSLDQVDDYRDSPDKAALNLGVYSADAMYLALYGKTQEYILFSSACQRMANELGVREGFGMDLMERLNANVDNRDSVCNILNASVQRARRSLEEDGQAREATLIAIGAFMESLHLLAVSIKNYHGVAPNENQLSAIRALLREKDSIKPIRDRLATLDNDETIAWLAERLSTLENEMNSVKANTALPNDGLKANSLDAVLPLVSEIREYIVR